MTDEQIRQERKDGFCNGFAYGCRYGYEEVIDGKMPNKEIFSTWLIAGMKFDELEKEE